MKKLLLSVTIFLYLVVTCQLFAMESEKVNIHGFIAQGYLQTDKNNFFANTIDGTFQFNELGINFINQFSNDFRIGMQFFARDIGEMGNDDIILDWAYADYRFKRWLGIKAGKVKLPLSFYSDIRDMDHLRTWIFLPQGVYHEIRRDTFATRKGIELCGTTPHTALGLFQYQAQIGILKMSINDGNIRFNESLVYPIYSIIGIEVKPGYLGRINWEPPLDGLRLYVTYSEYEYDIDTVMNVAPPPPPPGQPLPDLSLQKVKDLSLFFGAEYSISGITLTTEYFREDEEQIAINAPDIPIVERLREGWYISGTYRFNDWIETGLYYSIYDPDRESEEYERQLQVAQDTQSPLPLKFKFESTEYCATVRFDINEFWTFKIEAHQFDGTAVLIAQDQEGLSESETDQSYRLLAAKCSFNF